MRVKTGPRGALQKASVFRPGEGDWNGEGRGGRGRKENQRRKMGVSGAHTHTHLSTYPQRSEKPVSRPQKKIKNLHYLFYIGNHLSPSFFFSPFPFFPPLHSLFFFFLVNPPNKHVPKPHYSQIRKQTSVNRKIERSSTTAF